MCEIPDPISRNIGVSVALRDASEVTGPNSTQRQAMKLKLGEGALKSCEMPDGVVCSVKDIRLKNLHGLELLCDLLHDGHGLILQPETSHGTHGSS